MKKLKLWCTILCLLVGLRFINSYKILGIFPYNGRSHHIIFSRFMEELAERNHEVTVVNYFPMKKTINLKQISLQDLNKETQDEVDLEMMYKDLPNMFWEFHFARLTAQAFENFARIKCSTMIDHPEILNMIKSDVHFDLIIVEQFVSDCGLALVSHFKSPAIGIAAHVLMPWTYARFGIPNHVAYVPNHFIGTGTKLSTWDRLKSAIINTYFNLIFKHGIQKTDHKIVTRILPETPDLEIVAKNLSLIMVNQFFPLTGSRVLPANAIEVGGMHIKQRALQDKEIIKFIEESQDGVVYISLGTVTRTTSLPENKLQELLSFIRSSRQRFLWKREEANLTDAPPNLMIRDWMPQVEILCHSNVVGFLSHGGMLGSAEAAHCGVPVINVPLFGDQFANSASLRESGLGVTVPYLQLDRIRLKEALLWILKPEHVARAKQISSQWRDRPLPPMETAVYWAEYVARHGGAPQLRPPTVDLPLYQYLMLDALSIVAAIVSVFLYAVGVVSKLCFRLKGKRNSKRKIH